MKDWDKAMDFYKAAFGAVELFRVPGGGVGQLAVNGADFWVAEESPPNENFSPQTLGGCSVRILLIVEDPAAVVARAVRTAPGKWGRFETNTAGASAGLSIPPDITGKSPGSSPDARRRSIG